MRTRIVRRAAAVVCASLLVAGLSTTSVAAAPTTTTSKPDVTAKLIAAAKKEGTLVWYSGYTEAPTKRVADAFTKQYGIKVEWLRLAGADLINRISTEMRAKTKKPADAIMLTDNLFLADAYEKGWIVKLNPKEIPALASFPARFRSDSYFTAAIFPWGVVVNTNKVPEADWPRSPKDLLDEKFKGKILYADPRTSVTVMANMDFYYERYGREFVRDFGRQVGAIYPSATPAIQALIAGQGSLMLQADPGTLMSFQAAGAPVKVIVFPETTSFNHNIAITKSARHPNAARLFANWLATFEGQRALVVGAYSPFGNIPKHLQDIALPGGYVAPNVVRSRERSEMLLSLLGIR